MTNSKKKVCFAVILVLILGVCAAIGYYGFKSDKGGGWGDSDGGRPSYTVDQINDGVLGDIITFNSISDGKIGDERNFVGAKLAGMDGEWKTDSIKVADGETYTVRLYVHNNSPKGKEAIAEDVKASFSLPTTVSKSQEIIGYLDSSNAQPSRYWSGVRLYSDDQFFIEYVSGSARYRNSVISDISLDDSIITSSGALLGYDSLNGRIPGCYEYDGEVTIDVTVHKFER